MQIKQNRIILILSVDAYPLLGPVDIDVHRLVDTTLWGKLVYTLANPSGEKKHHNERENDNSPLSGAASYI